jgi:hypothetical protein
VVADISKATSTGTVRVALIGMVIFLLLSISSKSTISPGKFLILFYLRDDQKLNTKQFVFQFVQLTYFHPPLLLIPHKLRLLNNMAQLPNIWVSPRVIPLFRVMDTTERHFSTHTNQTICLVESRWETASHLFSVSIPQL